ncbi:FecR domain-containing protein [Novosphingobium sp.]|uniref:FecR domain-containing protein n=1 Tax=Novosphingobium sp. TaxID=1874826 RepID=UPI00286DB79C|nr:FecR domain-containing protein [Novosphingobium sp.]
MGSGPLHAAQGGEDTFVYTVKRSDTLYGLAQGYLIGPNAWREVQAANRVRIPRNMPVGYRLAIPRRLLKFTPVALRVQTFSGPVAVSGAEMRKGLELAEGSVITTGANGFVVISGADGSRIALPSNTRVKIGQARKYLLMPATDIELQVDRGKAEVQAAKQAPDSRFRVRTPVAVTAVRGTVFRAGYSEEAASSASETIEGEVAVAAGKAELAVPAGFGAAAKAGRGLAKEALLPAPTLADPAKVQTEVQVSFDFKPIERAQSYRIQVARDAGFLEVIAELQAQRPHAEFEGLTNGMYFVRAAGFSAAGLQGLEEAYAFRRQRLGLAADAGQAGLPGGFRFAWQSEGEGTSLFRFQLFNTSDDGLPLVDEPALGKPEMTITGLRPGAYRWRVGVIQTTPDGSAQVWLPFQKLTVGG